MKNIKFKLKRVNAIAAVAGDPNRQLPDQPEKTTLVLSPEDFNSAQSKLEIAVPEGEDPKDYQRGDIFEVSIRRVSRAKAGIPHESQATGTKSEAEETEGEEKQEQETSKAFPAHEAKDKIASLNDPEEIKAFVKGDDRVTVEDAAKDRIKDLKKEEKAGEKNR